MVSPVIHKIDLLPKKGPPVKRKRGECVSLAIMSPLTTKVKCPHYERQTNFQSEAIEAVASVEDGVRGANDFERGNATNACELSSC